MATRMRPPAAPRRRNWNPATQRYEDESRYDVADPMSPELRAARAKTDALVAGTQGYQAATVASEKRITGIAGEDLGRQLEHDRTLADRAAFVNAPTQAELDRRGRLSADAQALTQRAANAADPAVAGARARARGSGATYPYQALQPPAPTESYDALYGGLAGQTGAAGPTVPVAEPQKPATEFQPERMQAIVSRSANTKEAPTHVARAMELEEKAKGTTDAKEREALLDEAGRERQVAQALRSNITLPPELMKQRQKIGGLGPDTGAIERPTGEYGPGGPGTYKGGITGTEKMIQKSAVQQSAAVERIQNYATWADEAAKAGDLPKAEWLHKAEYGLRAQLAEEQGRSKQDLADQRLKERGPSEKVYRLMQGIDASTTFDEGMGGGAEGEWQPTTPKGQAALQALQHHRGRMTPVEFEAGNAMIRENERTGKYGPAGRAGAVGQKPQQPGGRSAGGAGGNLNVPLKTAVMNGQLYAIRTDPSTGRSYREPIEERQPGQAGGAGDKPTRQQAIQWASEQVPVGENWFGPSRLDRIMQLADWYMGKAATPPATPPGTPPTAPPAGPPGPGVATGAPAATARALAGHASVTIAGMGGPPPVATQQGATGVQGETGLEPQPQGAPAAAPGQPLPNGLIAATLEETKAVAAKVGGDSAAVEAELNRQGKTAMYTDTSKTPKPVTATKE